MTQSNEKECAGCREEMIEAYKYQEVGIDAGLDWDKFGAEHCFVFALDKKGELIVW